jgi:hypothetical protein
MHPCLDLESPTMTPVATVMIMNRLETKLSSVARTILGIFRTQPRHGTECINVRTANSIIPQLIDVTPYCLLNNQGHEFPKAATCIWPQ